VNFQNLVPQELKISFLLSSSSHAAVATIPEWRETPTFVATPVNAYAKIAINMQANKHAVRPSLVSLERGLVQVPESLHVTARFESELVHGDIRRHAAAARAPAAGADWWLTILSCVKHCVNAGNGLPGAGGRGRSSRSSGRRRSS
jgi:hypothetical protein